MPSGAFRMDIPWLTAVYGAGLPNLAQFLSLSGALPVVNVGAMDITYWKDPVGEFSPRNANYQRAPGTTFKPVSTGATRATTSLVDHGAEAVVDRLEASSADYPNILEANSRKVMMEILGNLEADFVTFWETAGNFGTSTAASALSGQWSSDSSRPFDDVATQVRGIATATGGIRGRVHMSITDGTAHRLTQHAMLRDAVKYTGGAVGMEALASYFAPAGVDQLHIKSARYNSADEAEAFSGAEAYADNCEIWVAQDQSTEVNDGSWGKLFWYDNSDLNGSAPFNGLPIIQASEPHWREEIDSWVRRIRGIWKLELTNSAAARRITDVLA